MQGKVSKLTKQLISSLQPAIKKINAPPVMDLFTIDVVIKGQFKRQKNYLKFFGGIH